MNRYFHIFKTPSGSIYLYDANSNTIHPWNPPLDESLAHDIYHASDKELDELVFPDQRSRQIIHHYIKLWRIWTDAFQQTGKRSLPEYASFDDIPHEINGPLWLSDMIIIPTDACNQRCEYCTFSETQYGHLRSHSNKMMSWETASKAIDLFFGYNDKMVFRTYTGRALNIVFYGGEPLLNWNIVRKCIAYAEKTKRDHYKLMTSISTNLTLLKKEHLPFLRDNNVFINVSLDGPEEEHNRYRHLANGEATFEKVTKNLSMIRAFDKEYFGKYVRVLPTITGNTDLKAVYDFFETNKETLPPIQTMSFLRDMETCGFHEVFPYDEDNFRNRALEVRDDYVKRKLGGEKFIKGDFLYYFIDDLLSRLFNSMHAIDSRRSWYTGTCLPTRKISVAPDGLIHICERICEDFPLGNVDEGVDFQKATRLVNDYYKSAPNCTECWARHFCNICHAAVGESGRFIFGERCAALREQVSSDLSLLYSILEQRPDAFVGEFNFY